MSRYALVYPRGDRSQIEVVEICDGLEYELSDYYRADNVLYETCEEAIIARGSRQ